MDELQQYRSVVEDQTEIICRTKGDGTLTFVNDVYCRVFEKTRDEVIGSTWHPDVFPEDLPMVKEKLSTLSPSNKVVVIEKRIYTGSGKVIWMQFVNRGFFDTEGRLLEIQAVGRDITERKETENSLRTSEERLNMALAAANMGVWEWNIQTSTLFWSPETLKIFGVESFSGTLESFTNALHPDDADRLMATAKQALAEKTTFIMEYRIIRPDGQVHWLSDHARPIYDDKGNPLRLTGTVHDITERKRSEAELMQLNADLAARTAELENSNRELAAFNYMASHDLCQPLNNIFTSAQAIELMCVDKIDEESKNFLQIIKNGAMNMRNLIGMFLGFSQSEHAELHGKMVDLSEMARVITAGLRLSDSGRQATFKIEEGVKAYGDPELLRVVLENIIGNAWKYTGNREQATIEFGVMEMDGRKTYFIRDNGLGFDMREAEKLFLPFKCLHGSEELKGHGIGLATVERIIRRHGGKIRALGEPGKGATIFFTLGE
ncbi:MAG TPA: PAS domain S-box protein [Dongiaceae bacterium]|nr:PAS domain S-box protein [Dongiaceae bacterium]